MGGATSNPAFQAGQRTSEFGTWTQTGRNSYSAFDEALIAFSGGMFTAGFQTLTHSITLQSNGNSFIDDARVQFYDANGTALLPSPGCAVGTATRQPHD